MSGHFKASVFLVVYALMVDAADYSYPTPAFSLDPYLGTYDFIWSTGVNAFEFLTQVLGVPPDIAVRGERVVFNRTLDGHYRQSVRRNDSTYNLIIPSFDLGTPGTVQIPGTSQTVDYNIVMLNATTLQTTYDWHKDKTITFVLTWWFSADGSRANITNDVKQPVLLFETGTFYRVPGGDVDPITTGPSS